MLARAFEAWREQARKRSIKSRVDFFTATFPVLASLERGKQDACAPVWDYALFGLMFDKLPIVSACR